MNKKWEAYGYDVAKVQEIAKRFNVSELMAKILLNRGLDETNIDKFLHPNLENLYDPFQFKGMDLAVDRLLKAIKDK